MRLKIGTKITHGGLKGRIRRHCNDMAVAMKPGEKGEWYFCEIYKAKKVNDKTLSLYPHGYWKIERRYLEVRE